MEPTLAQIILFAGNFPPRGWAYCDGQLLDISQNTALFSLLGTIYGGDGRTTFALPDLRGRAPIHSGNGPGLSSYRQGQKGGLENVTLSTSQLPAHFHVLTASSLVPNKNVAEGASLASGNEIGSMDKIYTQSTDKVNLNSSTTNSGGGQPHENRPPFIALNYIIATVGIYPSRS